MKFLLVLLLLPAMAFSQTTITIERDTMTMVHALAWPHATTLKRALVLSNGGLIETYATLKLGYGSLPDGSYNFIIKSSSDLDPNLKFDTPIKELPILQIRRSGNKKSGYKYDAICQGNYLVHLNEALASGEIL
jgi:hypothetical protein